MALDPVIEDLLKLVPGPEAEKAKEFFETSPALQTAIKDGTLRQSDYSRKSAEVQAEQRKWKEWYEGNVTKHQTLRTDYDRLNGELTSTREEIEKLRSGELDVDEATLNAKVDARLKSLGDSYVSKTELNAIIAQEASKLATEAAKTEMQAQSTKFLTETWPAATEILASLMEASYSHREEFGKPLTREDRQAIGALMKEQNIMDPQEAYKRWVSPQRTEVEIKKKVDAGIEEYKKTHTGNEGFPAVTGAPELGPVQMARAGKLPTLPENYSIGDGSAAAAAAAELRAEAKV